MNKILFILFSNILLLHASCPDGCVDPFVPPIGAEMVINNYLSKDQKLANEYKVIEDKIDKSIEHSQKVLDNTTRRLKLYVNRNVILQRTNRHIENINSILTSD